MSHQTLGTYGLLMAAWVVAWVLKVELDSREVWLASSAGSFAYWTAAKTLIWILPALWLIRISGRTLRQAANFANWKGWLAWGGSIGALIALTGVIPSYLGGRPLLPTAFSYSLLNVLIVAPLFEELLFRGALMVNLQPSCGFWRANAVASLLFVGLHLPGWYFMGTLPESLVPAVARALPLFLVGLAFGYAVHRSRSVMGGVLAHFLNNLAPNS